jgi:hypothetical protein
MEGIRFEGVKVDMEQELNVNQIHTLAMKNYRAYLDTKKTPEEKTKDILNQMRTAHAIVEWQTAQRFLNDFGDDASEAIRQALSHGLNEIEVNHLIYLVETLEKEA